MDPRIPPVIPPLPTVQKKGHGEAIAIAVILLVIVFAGGAFWYQFRDALFPAPAPEPPQAVVPPPASSVSTSGDLGTELYEKSQNPLRGKIPDTLAPVPNPLQNVYNNPFQ